VRSCERWRRLSLDSLYGAGAVRGRSAQRHVLKQLEHADSPQATLSVSYCALEDKELELEIHPDSRPRTMMRQDRCPKSRELSDVMVDDPM
jgi:hypothetical protein